MEKNISLEFNPKKNDLLAQYTCPICLQLIIEIVVTKCNHYFCFYCLEEMRDNTIDDMFQCPMCRGKLDKFSNFEINQKEENIIKEFFPHEYQDRYFILEKYKKLNSNLHKLKIKYGNKHKLVKFAKNSVSSPEEKNKHDWSAFVKVEGVDENSIIEMIQFKLHSSFHNPLVTVSNSPFKVSRIGWGIFEIPIKIFWKKFLNCPPTELTHTLSFEGEGKYSEIIVKFDKDLLRNNNIL